MNDSQVAGIVYGTDLTSGLGKKESESSMLPQEIWEGKKEGRGVKKIYSSINTIYKILTVVFILKFYKLMS